MVSLSPKTQAIMGNPNLSQDVALQTQRGNIASEQQRDTERISSIAKGISTAADNYYKIKDQSSEIEARDASTESRNILNESASMQLKRDKATEEADMQIHLMKTAKETAQADIAAQLAETSKIAYKYGSSSNTMERIQLLSHPQFQNFRAKNSKYIDDLAKNLYNTGGPAVKQVVQQQYYDPLQRGKQKELAVAKLKEFDKKTGLIDKAVNSSDLLSYISREDIKNAIPVTRNGVADARLKDGRYASDVFAGIPEEGGAALTGQLAKFSRQYGEISTSRENTLASASGVEPARLQQRAQAKQMWDAEMSKAASSGTDDASKLIAEAQIKELEKYRNAPEQYFQKQQVKTLQQNQQLLNAPQGSGEVVNTPNTNNFPHTDTGATAATVPVTDLITMDAIALLEADFRTSNTINLLNDPATKEQYLRRNHKNMSYEAFMRVTLSDMVADEKSKRR